MAPIARNAILIRILKIGLKGITAIALTAVAPLAVASPDGETGFVLNSFSFILWGALVMWMCAGFTMLESGSVRTKNASVICLKNIGLYAIAGLAYYTIGYNLMYIDVSGFIGTFTLFYSSTPEEVALLGGDSAALGTVIESGYSTMSDWFFQMVLPQPHRLFPAHWPNELSCGHSSHLP